MKARVHTSDKPALASLTSSLVCPSPLYNRTCANLSTSIRPPILSSTHPDAPYHPYPTLTTHPALSFPSNDTFATKQAAIDHYHEEIDGLLAAGIVPMVTLLHFTHPLWFEDRGGFERDDSPACFVAFARRMYQEYGGKVGGGVPCTRSPRWTRGCWHAHAGGSTDDPCLGGT